VREPRIIGDRQHRNASRRAWQRDCGIAGVSPQASGSEAAMLITVLASDAEQLEAATTIPSGADACCEV